MADIWCPDEPHVDADYKTIHDLSDEELLGRLETLGARWEEKYSWMMNGNRATGMPLTSAELSSCLLAIRSPPEYAKIYKFRQPADNVSVKAISAALGKEPAVEPEGEALEAAFGLPQMSDRELIANYGQPSRLNSAKFAKHMQGLRKFHG